MTSVKDRTTASRSPGDGSQDLKSRNGLSWDNTTLTLQTTKQRPRAKPPHALVSSLLPGAAPEDGTGAHLAQGAGRAGGPDITGAVFTPPATKMQLEMEPVLRTRFEDKMSSSFAHVLFLREILDLWICMAFPLNLTQVKIATP